MYLQHTLSIIESSKVEQIGKAKSIETERREEEPSTMNFDPSLYRDEQRTLFAIVCLQSNEECIFHLGMMSKKPLL
jgi:hypothetical protein